MCSSDLLYPSHVARIDAGRAVEARVVGVVVYDAAPREQQCEADGRGRHDKLSDCLHFDRGRERAPARKVAVRMCGKIRYMEKIVRNAFHA